MHQYFRILYNLDDGLMDDDDLVDELHNAYPELSRKEAREIVEEYLLAEEYEDETDSDWDWEFSTGGHDRHRHED